MKNKILQYLLAGVGVVLLLSLAEILFNQVSESGVNDSWHMALIYTKIFTGIVTFGFIAFHKKHLLLINVFFFMAFLYLAEILFIKSYASFTPVQTNFGGSYIGYFFEPSENLGYQPIASNQVNAMKITEFGDTLYHVYYSIDEYSRRKTLLPPNANPDQFAVFWGGSFVFGEGLNEEYTLSTLFSENNPEFMAYNYGFCGYGPNQMLALIQSERLPKEIVPAQKGIGIYVYIDDHISRAIGSMDRVMEYSASHPYFNFEDGKLVRKGSFESAGFVKRYEKMKWLKNFHCDYPIRLQKKHYKLTLSMIEESQRLFKKQFPESDFYMLIYPGEDNKILSYIDNPQINILDYSRLFTRNEHRIKTGIDHHPNAEANQIVIDKLTEDIQKINKQEVSINHK